MQHYQLDKTIDFILAGQEDSGSFPTYEYFPLTKPELGWRALPDPSPFIVSNILYCLLEIDNQRCKGTITKACNYIESVVEFGGFFRFWPHASIQAPIPVDMDDSAMCSYILEQCGRTVDNKEVLLANVNSKGYLLTWLQPNLRLLFHRPKAFIGFSIGCIQGIPTRILRYFFYKDTEPGVAANALLYLKENEQTRPCIEAVINEVNTGKFPLLFYEDELVVYYHIVRAYKHSIPSFGALRNTITERIQNRFKYGFDSANPLWLCMAAITLMNYEADFELAEKLIAEVAKSEMCSSGNWLSIPYSCSNDRVWLCGSPHYTAAVYAEAVAKLLRHKQNRA